ncbi:MAG: hypothetical protein M0P31_17590 [Solirubrobacteraceae bacterium]|nr:hypothetical protein [Solirubrobacteraceae bacterium]
MTLLPRLHQSIVEAVDAETTRIARPRRWLLPVTLGALFATAAVATAAMTGVWSPDPEDIGGRALAVDASAPPAGQLAALGVLRRSATSADRDAVALASLRYAPDVVRSNHVRRPGPSGAIIVPIVHHDARMDALGGTVRTRNAICLVDGPAGGCTTTARIRAYGTGLQRGHTYTGIVPDGVATVLLRSRTDGKTVSVPVHDNAYVVDARRLDVRPAAPRWQDHKGRPVAPTPVPRAGDPDVTAICDDGRTLPIPATARSASNFPCK